MKVCRRNRRGNGVWLISLLAKSDENGCALAVPPTAAPVIRTGGGLCEVREWLTNNGWGWAGRKMWQDSFSLVQATPSLVNDFWTQRTLVTGTQWRLYLGLKNKNVSPPLQWHTINPLPGKKRLPLQRRRSWKGDLSWRTSNRFTEKKMSGWPDPLPSF